MTRINYQVFSPGKIGNLVLKNRLVRSATYEKSMTSDGKVTDEILRIYSDLACGGAGMIITGLMAVTPSGKGYTKQACLYNDEQISEIAQIADLVHKGDSNCVIIAQLNHSGRQILLHENSDAECVGPSAVGSPILTKQPRELSTEEVEAIIKSFADAIVRVKKAGFDGAQLHAAHGYLLSSFLSPHTNRRNDKFGGSVRNRVKIIKDIVWLARQVVQDFPILIKINSDDHIEGGIGKENFAELFYEVQDSGVDAIEVSGGMWDCLARTKEELGFIPVPIPEARIRINDAGKQSYYYDYVKKIDSRVPVILVGGHRNIERIENILKEGKVNFVSLCRPFISEPALPNRWLDGIGKDNADCVSCNGCLAAMGEFGCAIKKAGFNREFLENMLTEQWRGVFK